MQRNRELATPLMTTQPVSTGCISTKPLGRKTSFLLKSIQIKSIVSFVLKIKAQKSDFFYLKIIGRKMSQKYRFDINRIIEIEDARHLHLTSIGLKFASNCAEPKRHSARCKII